MFCDQDDLEEGFPVSDKERAFIENDIANKEAIIEALEENNDNGDYDNEISSLENEVSGLKRFLGK